MFNLKLPLLKNKFKIGDKVIARDDSFMGETYHIVIGVIIAIQVSETKPRGKIPAGYFVQSEQLNDFREAKAFYYPEEIRRYTKLDKALE